MPLNDPTSRQLPPVPEPKPIGWTVALTSRTDGLVWRFSRLQARESVALACFHAWNNDKSALKAVLHKVYTAEQLQQCAEAATAEERARAARVCDPQPVAPEHMSQEAQIEYDTRLACAAAIRKGA